jgi:hypothetical protein
MTRRARLGIAAFAASCGVSIALAAQEPVVTFRSSTGIVLVPVWVKDGEKSVEGLTASDFEVLDNGVPQEVASVATASQPVDVTVVLDTSGSLDDDSLDTLRSGVEQIGRSLTPADRMRLLTFATGITDVFGFRAGGQLPPMGRIGSGGTTALFDALGAALLSTPRSDRPQLVFGVTDGLDTASFLEAGDVRALATASGASLYVTVVRTAPAATFVPGVRGVARGVRREVLWVIERLRDVTGQTGGLVFDSPPGTALPALFDQVLSDFRTSYLVSFTPRGVRQGGWHELVVTTKGRRYTVRARTGYQGRSPFPQP